MSVEAALHELSQDSGFLRHVTAWRQLPAQPARAAPFPPELAPELSAALHNRGIDSLYVHQAAAWQAARRGENLVVVTATASGKTLCYNLPILHHLLADEQARALYLFPTKALTQDQLAELNGLGQALGDRGDRLSAAAYDGDTPRHERARIRRQARILLTNPDMLHTGILPHHPRWAGFFAHLRFLVIDELHAYRGVFGSHCANVLRRLRRICRFHGSDLQALCASATIANPQELAERLLEAPVTLIEDDGAPKGERHFLFYNPPIVNPELGLRRSSTLEAEAIAGRLVNSGVQTIVFARSRLTVELLLTYLRQRMGRGDGPRVGQPAQVVRGYRGGYLPGERRAIERGLREGGVRAVVATNALELGVNIGGLDAAVLTGFPGAIASAWQQAGRAGRQGAVSLAILVATAGALDQYVINHPDYFFGHSPEQALINPDNLIILSSHVACAAFELPFKKGERFGQVDFTAEVLAYLAEEGELQQHGGDWFWMGEAHPAGRISLRTASPDNVIIMAGGAGREGTATTAPLVIGELERAGVPLLLYEGAVYLHEGESYLVERLDWEKGQVWVTPAQVGYYTQASTSQQVEVLSVHEMTAHGGVSKAHGQVQVISKASAYRKVKLRTHEILGFGPIDLPEQVLETTAYWITLAEDLLEGLRSAGLWRSDPNDYGSNWQEQRRAARRRDDYRCTLCGRPEMGGRQHDVHHKTPFRMFGYVAGLNENYRLANRLENLATLCRNCHRRVEQGRRLRTGLGGLAYVLGNVAPLHLMCDPRDIGVVSEVGSGPRRQRQAGGETSQQRLPTITIYEKTPAGIGFSQRLYELHEDLLRAAGDVVRQCFCQAGCPACVGPISEAFSTPDLGGPALLLEQAATEGQPAAGVSPKQLTLALIEAALTAL